MYHPEELSIELSDLKRIFFSKKKMLKKVALWGFFCTFLFFLFKEPLYVSTSSFRSAPNKEAESLDVKHLIKSALASSREDFTLSILHSEALLLSVIEKMGLQAQIKEKNILSLGLLRVWENVMAELGFSLSDQDPFLFKDVVFEGENPLKLYLVFLSKDTFEVLTEKKHALAKSGLNQNIELSNASFILEKAPMHLQIGKAYPLTFTPISDLAQTLKKRLEIKPAKMDGHLLHLTFSDRNRHLASRFINQLTNSYQDFLKKENEEIVSAQIAYLNKRQKELSLSLEETFHEHKHYLENNLKESGFIGLAQEIEILSVPKQEYLSRLFEIELELKRLESTSFAKKIEPSLDGAIFESKMCSTNILQNSLSALAYKKKIGRENAEFIKDSSCKIPLINLGSLQELYQNAQEELSTVHAQIRQFIHVQEQMQTPHFELSSLSAILEDKPLIQLLQKTVELSSHLADTSNRSPKEIERIKEALEVQKKSLQHRVEQSIELYKVQARALESKIHSLQNGALDFLKLEKNLVEQKLRELDQKMSDLPEKWFLENKLEFEKELSLNMLQGMSSLIEAKNVHQHLYHIGSKPLDKATPSKKPKSSGLFLYSILCALFISCSLYLFYLFRTLYRGLPLTKERLKKSMHLFGGKFSSSLESGLKQLGCSDLETLRAISSYATSKKSACVSIIRGEHPSFSHSLAELISLKGEKVLLLECVFDAVVPLEHIPGLWHYLEGKVDSCPIKQKGGYDFVPTGGATRHGRELLEKENFLQLVSGFKEKYDLIIIESSAHLFSSEALTHTKIADKLIIAVADEPLEELHEYTSWAKQEGKEDSLIFVSFAE